MTLANLDLIDTIEHESGTYNTYLLVTDEGFQVDVYQVLPHVSGDDREEKELSIALKVELNEGSNEQQQVAQIEGAITTQVQPAIEAFLAGRANEDATFPVNGNLYNKIKWVLKNRFDF